jgi:hypothetical protein
MRLIATLIFATVLAAGLLNVLSDTAEGFSIFSDGSRAIFSFTHSNWDAVFGTISLREMNDKVSTLEQALNATLAKLNAFEAQQAVSFCSFRSFLMHLDQRPDARHQDCELGS